MTEADLDELLRRRPMLYHMAKGGSWPSIQRHGLCSTSALLDLFGTTSAERDAIEASHRPRSVRIDHPVHGTAWIRDQKPMSDTALRRCLQPGLAPADWYRLLNRRVYFWADRDRLLKLLGGREYRDTAHDVIEVDTAALVAAHRPRIELSAINSGATFPLGPAPRGLDTFRTIEGFEGGWRRVVEVTVHDAVPDLACFVRRVISMQGAAEMGAIYERTR